MTALGDVLDIIRVEGETTGYFVAKGNERKGYFFTQNHVNLPQDCDVWFSLNPGTDSGKGRVTRQTVTRLAALHADLDVDGGGKHLPSYEAAQQVVDDLSGILGTAPIAIISSGHGVQPIWGIEPEAFAGDEASALLKRWGTLVQRVAANRGGEVDSVFELARLVRAPGSINHKAAPVSATSTPTGGRLLAVDEIRDILAQYVPRETVAPQAGLTSLGGPKPSAPTSWEQKVVPEELQKLRDLPRPWIKGARWDLTIFEVACTLTEIANSDWAYLTHDMVAQLVMRDAPYDSAWDGRIAKVESARAKVGTNARPVPKVVLSEQVDIFANATTTPQGAPQTVSPAGGRRGWDDADNALRAHEATKGKLLWLTDASTWARWTEAGWEVDPAEGARAVQKAFDEARVSERADWPELDEKQWLKFTARGRNSGAVKSATEWLHRTGLCDARMDSFDREPNLLRAPNGVVDLRTGELLAADPSHRLLRRTEVAYDEHAAAPEFERWLKYAQPDEGVRDYLQLVFGASLTGNRVKRYWVHEGVADAGKSMLVGLMSKALGDTAVSINDNLVEGRSNVYGDEYHRAALRGARLAVLDETRQGGHTLEKSIKQLVGGSTLVGRNPTERPFSFTPVFKLHIATNDAPMNSPDPAIRKRLEVIRWNVGATTEMLSATAQRLGMPLDEHLTEKELPGILAWAVRGAVRWYEGSMLLSPPLTVSMATDEHMAEGDLVARWLAEDTFEKEGAEMGAMQGWDAFRMWRDRTGERGGPDSLRAWGLQMTRIVDMDPSLQKVRRSSGMVYIGRRTASAAWTPPG